MNNNETDDTNVETDVDKFFNFIACGGLSLMILAVVSAAFGGSPISINVPVGNKSAEIHNTIRQIGFININFGDAKGESRND